MRPAPTALTTRLRRMRRRAAGSVSAPRWRFQWMIIEIWLSVNEMNTPTTYIWMSIVTEALKTRTSTTAPTASVMMPLE